MKSMQKILGQRLKWVVLVLTLVSVATVFSSETQPGAHRPQGKNTRCQPTPPDYLGPFYKAGAPVRASVGKGYRLKGTVMSSEDCSPIKKARIELWLTNPEGSYDDDHRATILSGDSGEYEFESNFPPGYSGRPPHIHIRVTASGYKTLITQHYPPAAEGSAEGTFDLVLVAAD